MPVLLSLIVLPSGPAIRGARRARAAPRIVQIQTGDNMKFAPAAFTAAPGEPITVVLKHTGQMPKMAMGHNFVLLKKASDAKGVVDSCDVGARHGVHRGRPSSRS